MADSKYSQNYLGQYGVSNALTKNAVPEYQTVSEVRSHQVKLSNYLKMYQPQTRIESGIIETTQRRLQILYDKLLKEEKQFTRTLKAVYGLNTYTDLKNAVETWNNSGASVLLNEQGRIDKIVNNIKLTMSPELLRKKMTLVINDPQTAREITRFLQSFIGERLDIDIVKKFIGQHLEGKKVQWKHFEQAVLPGAITFSDPQQLPNGKYVIEVTITTKGNEKVSEHYIKLIKDALAKSMSVQKVSLQLNDDVNITLTPELKQKIAVTVLSYIWDNQVKKSVRYQLFNNFVKSSNIAINSSSSAIKGFLGELYWSSFWYYMSQGKTDKSKELLLTGSILNQHKQQIPVDILFLGAGLQVKNYPKLQIKHGPNAGNNVANLFGKDLSIQGYINRAMPQGVGEVLIDAFSNYYFSWSYNKPADGVEGSDIYRDQIFSEFEKILDKYAQSALRQIGVENLNHLIHLNETYAIDKSLEDMFLRDKLNNKQNLAYLINDCFVFSSDIVKGIIELLGDSMNSKINIFSLQFHHSEPESGAEWPNQGKFKNLITNAKYGSVSYQIHLNLDKLINSYLSAGTFGAYPG